MSLYADYIKEREDKQIIESDNGFATYSIFDNGECYLQDIYVAPEQRKTGLGSEMADEVCRVALDHGCHTLLGSVCANDKNATRNMKVFIAYGMQIYKNVGSLIFLKKKIGVE